MRRIALVSLALVACSEPSDATTTDDSSSSSSSVSEAESTAPTSDATSTASNSADGSGSDTAASGSGGESETGTDDGGGSTGGGACTIDTPPLECTAPGAVMTPCDMFAQDCPDGEKCTLDVGWQSTICVAIAESPDQLGDPCTFDRPGDPTAVWLDSCDEGLMCEGTCVPLCSCSAASPVCDAPNSYCSVTSGPGGPIYGHCTEWCSPFDETSCDGKCVGGVEEVYLVCVPGGAGGDMPVGQPCGAFHQCEEGSKCGVGVVPGCPEPGGCCTPFCEVGDDSPCLPGQSCVPYFAPGEAPDDCLAMVGVCSA